MNAQPNPPEEIIFGKFYAELRRRKVFRVGLVYLAVDWLSDSVFCCGKKKG